MINRNEVRKPRKPINMANIFLNEIINNVRSAWLHIIKNKHEVRTYRNPEKTSHKLQRPHFWRPASVVYVLFTTSNSKARLLWIWRHQSLTQQGKGICFSVMSRDSSRREAGFIFLRRISFFLRKRNFWQIWWQKILLWVTIMLSRRSSL